MTAPTIERPPRIPRLVRALLLTVAIAGSFVGLFYVGQAAQTGSDATSNARPSFVERLIPASGSNVVRQSEVGIDVADGYKAYLVINGVEVREADGLTTSGAGLWRYQPGPGKKVESLAPDRNTVLAFVWREAEGEKTAQVVSWSFQAL